MPVELIDISRIVYSGWSTLLCDQPEEKSAWEATQALRKILVETPNPSFPIEKLDRFLAQFPTPEELEVFVAKKKAERKRQGQLESIVDQLREMSVVLDKHPTLTKYADLSTIETLLKIYNGSFVEKPSDSEKEEILCREFIDLSREAAARMLKESNGDLIQAAHDYMWWNSEI